MGSGSLFRTGPIFPLSLLLPWGPGMRGKGPTDIYVPDMDMGGHDGPYVVKGCVLTCTYFGSGCDGKLKIGLNT